MICDFNKDGVCNRCERRQSRPGFARMCCGSPGCSVDSILRKFSPEEYAKMSEMRLPQPGPGHGPGTELKKLLANWPFRIVATPNCSCNARAAEMDRQGIEWCEANLDTIVGWLREEATKRRLPFLDAAGRLLVKRAIRNARKAAS
jgi:hypothetical protein